MCGRYGGRALRALLSLLTVHAWMVSKCCSYCSMAGLSGGWAFDDHSYLQDTLYSNHSLLYGSNHNDMYVMATLFVTLTLVSPRWQ